MDAAGPSHADPLPLATCRGGAEAGEPRVLQVIDNLSLGGAQRLLVTLAQHLGPDRALPVLVISGGKTPMHAELLAAGADLREEAGVTLWNPLSWISLARALRRSGAEIVHLHLTYATILAAPLARLQGKRVIVSLHNAQTTRGAGGASRMRTWVLGALETASLRLMADQVVFVGENVAVANRRRIGRVPGVTIANVIAPPRPRDSARRSSVRGALGAGADDVVLIATGRLSEQKNPLGLLRAFGTVRKDVKTAQLWLVGDGLLRREVEALRTEMELESLVHILGERSDVGDLLEAADIFVLASAWEGLPLGLLEAMAQGLAIVATASGDVPRVLAPGTGRLVPVQDAAALAEAMAELASAPRLRAELGEEARRNAAPFTDIASWYRRYQDLYRG